MVWNRRFVKWRYQIRTFFGTVQGPIWNQTFKGRSWFGLQDHSFGLGPRFDPNRGTNLLPISFDSKPHLRTRTSFWLLCSVKISQYFSLTLFLSLKKTHLSFSKNLLLFQTLTLFSQFRHSSRMDFSSSISKASLRHCKFTSPLSLSRNPNVFFFWKIKTLDLC